MQDSKQQYENYLNKTDLTGLDISEVMISNNLNLQEGRHFLAEYICTLSIQEGFDKENFLKFMGSMFDLKLKNLR
jgi:hypothetical protein